MDSQITTRIWKKGKVTTIWSGRLHIASRVSLRMDKEFVKDFTRFVCLSTEMVMGASLVIVSERDEATFLALHSMLDRELCLTAIAMGTEANGIQPIAQPDRILKFQSGKICAIVYPRGDCEKGSSFLGSKHTSLCWGQRGSCLKSVKGCLLALSSACSGSFARLGSR